MNKNTTTNSVIKELKKNNYKNVAIFIDYDNLELSLRNFGLSAADTHFPVLETIIDAYKQKSSIRSIQAFGDFNKLRISPALLEQHGIETINVVSEHYERTYKDASDFALIIEAISMMYEQPDISTYVLVTSDQDFMRLNGKLKLHGKTVHVFYIATCTASISRLKAVSNRCVDLIEIMNVDLARTEPAYWTETLYQACLQWFAYGIGKKSIHHKQLQTIMCRTTSLLHESIDAVIKEATRQKLIIPNPSDGFRSYIPGEKMESEIESLHYEKTA